MLWQNLKGKITNTVTTVPTFYKQKWVGTKDFIWKLLLKWNKSLFICNSIFLLSTSQPCCAQRQYFAPCSYPSAGAQCNILRREQHQRDPFHIWICGWCCCSDSSPIGSDWDSGTDCPPAACYSRDHSCWQPVSQQQQVCNSIAFSPGPPDSQ